MVTTRTGIDPRTMRPVGGHRTWKEHPKSPAVFNKATVSEPAEC
jgi:hypothetical protein